MIEPNRLSAYLYVSEFIPHDVSVERDDDETDKSYDARCREAVLAAVWEVNKPLDDAESVAVNEIVEDYRLRGKMLADGLNYVFDHITVDMPKEDVQTVFYDAGKEIYGKPNLRAFFSDVYLCVSKGRTTSGPRLGELVTIVGKDRLRDTFMALTA